MKDTTLGIMIIIGILVIGLASGGKVFTGPKGLVSKDSNTKSSGNLLIPEKYTPPKKTSTKQPTAKSIEKQIVEVRKQIAAINASEYEDQVTMHVIKPGTFGEYITLSVRGSGNINIPITGWKFRSTLTGRTLVIGQASRLPHFESNQNITLTKGQKALIYSGSGSEGSFLINKCTGYFEQDDDFTPALSRQCPRPDTLVPQYSSLYFKDSCMDYLKTLPRCEVIDEDDIPRGVPSDCRNFVEDKLNYNSCVGMLRNNSDFYSKEWRVYARPGRINWRKDEDVIELIDLKGKIVDSISYK